MNGWLCLVLASTAVSAFGEGKPDLQRQLELLRAPAPASVTVRLELRVERTLHHKASRGEASVQLDVEEDGAGLRVAWGSTTLRAAAAEERERDAAHERLAVVREAMQELDPLRLSHLLDQTGTVAGLAKGEPVEAGTETYEGALAHRFVYRFEPRVSWTDAQSLRSSEGRFTLWTTESGVPLASESTASFEGKTSRTFGRYKGTTIVRTRYAVQAGRLRVATRDVDDVVSRDDGGQTEHSVRHFVIEPR
jgi:hypothetical protein